MEICYQTDSTTKIILDIKERVERSNISSENILVIGSDSHWIHRLIDNIWTTVSMKLLSVYQYDIVAPEELLFRRPWLPLKRIPF
jgi:hypothetical protein